MLPSEDLVTSMNYDLIKLLVARTIIRLRSKSLHGLYFGPKPERILVLVGKKCGGKVDVGYVGKS